MAADVIDSTATLTFTAPGQPGDYVVTVTGAQSAKQVTAKFTVRR